MIILFDDNNCGYAILSDPVPPNYAKNVGNQIKLAETYADIDLANVRNYVLQSGQIWEKGAVQLPNEVIIRSDGNSALLISDMPENVTVKIDGEAIELETPGFLQISTDMAGDYLISIEGAETKSHHIRLLGRDDALAGDKTFAFSADTMILIEGSTQ